MTNNEKHCLTAGEIRDLYRGLNPWTAFLGWHGVAGTMLRPPESSVARPRVRAMEQWEHGTLIVESREGGGGSIEFVTAGDSETVDGQSAGGRRQMHGLNVLAEDGWEVIGGPALLQRPNAVIIHYLVRRARP